MKSVSKNNLFKKCTTCDQPWNSQNDFLNDPDLELIGYQVHFEDLKQGLFLFNHHVCKSTISISSDQFNNLYHGPIYEENLFGSETCPNHCLGKTNLLPCPAKCECSYVRDVIQIINNWEK
jgi:hypothetical protein